MKHLKLFEEYIERIEEKASVPPGIVPYAEELSYRVDDEIADFFQKDNFDFETEVTDRFNPVLSEQFRVSKVNLLISCRLISNLKKTDDRKERRL